MNTNAVPDLRKGPVEALHKQETQEIIGCAFEVLNDLGHGLNEKLYENSLVVEFKRRRIAFDQQRRFEVLYKGEHVGEFAPDLIAFGAVVVDAKVIERITHHERGQMLNYLRITRLHVGLILNFKHAKLEWERYNFENAMKPQINTDEHRCFGWLKPPQQSTANHQPFPEHQVSIHYLCPSVSICG